jgi:hypothetical protein
VIISIEKPGQKYTLKWKGKRRAMSSEIGGTVTGKFEMRNNLQTCVCLYITGTFGELGVSINAVEMDVRECSWKCLMIDDCLSFSYSQVMKTCIIQFVKSNVLAMVSDSNYAVYDRVY